MKKWILVGGGAIVAIIIIVVIVGISNLGPMIKSAVNTYGPKITKTEVRLGDVDLSLFSAEAELKDFLLGNPAGFKTPKAMSVDKIYVNVDEKSITGDTITIDRIEVVAPDITYEKISGTDNFKTILKNVNEAVGTDKTAGKPAEKGKKGEGKKIIIKDFIVKEGKVNLTMSMLGERTISANLPDIRLRNIGEKKGGASPAEAFKQVFAELYAKVTSPAVTDVFNKGLSELKGTTKAAVEEAKKQLEGTSEGASKAVKDVTGKLKGLFGK